MWKSADYLMYVSIYIHTHTHTHTPKLHFSVCCFKTASLLSLVSSHRPKQSPSTVCA